PTKPDTAASHLRIAPCRCRVSMRFASGNTGNKRSFRLSHLCAGYLKIAVWRLALIGETFNPPDLDPMGSHVANRRSEAGRSTGSIMTEVGVHQAPQPVFHHPSAPGARDLVDGMANWRLWSML